MKTIIAMSALALTLGACASSPSSPSVPPLGTTGGETSAPSAETSAPSVRTEPAAAAAEAAAVDTGECYVYMANDLLALPGEDIATMTMWPDSSLECTPAEFAAAAEALGIPDAEFNLAAACIAEERPACAELTLPDRCAGMFLESAVTLLSDMDLVGAAYDDAVEAGEEYSEMVLDGFAGALGRCGSASAWDAGIEAVLSSVPLAEGAGGDSPFPSPEGSPTAANLCEVRPQPVCSELS